MQVIETMCYHLWRWIASISRSSTLVPPQWCVANYPILQNVPPHTVIASDRSETLILHPHSPAAFYQVNLIQNVIWVNMPLSFPLEVIKQNQV